MTLKNTKTILFASIIVAMVLPVSAMGIINATENGTIPDKVADKVIQIQKPVETQAEKDEFAQVEKLLTENIKLTEEAEVLETSSQDGTSLTQSETIQLDQIKERLTEISAEFGVIQTSSIKLYALTPEDRIQLLDALEIIDTSDIPYFGLDIDSKVGALVIGFETQQIADANILKIEQLIQVPYYINIPLGPDMDASCKNIDSNCNPLMGGIQITTQYNSTHTGDCSYSIPATRNLLFWQTEEGFVTAAHCFSGNNGNDVNQPNKSSSKIGDLTKYVLGGECDCAFVKKTGSESTLFGTWFGTDTSKSFTMKTDPITGTWVYMIGHQSGIKMGKVISTSYATTTDIPIKNTIKVNTAMTAGDSGGAVTGVLAPFTTSYLGMISKYNDQGGYTAIIPWSHIDVGLNLK